MDVLYGLHPVEEALKAGRRRFDHILVARERQDDRLQRLVAQCRQAGIRVRSESRDQLTAVAGTAAHQGIVALVRPQEFLSIEDLFASDSANPGAARLVLALDGVEDPQNLGALLRASPLAEGRRAPKGHNGIVLRPHAEALEAHDRAYFGALFEAADGNISEMARRAQLHRTTVREALERFDIKTVRRKG